MGDEKWKSPGNKYDICASEYVRVVLHPNIEKLKVIKVPNKNKNKDNDMKDTSTEQYEATNKTTEERSEMRWALNDERGSSKLWQRNAYLEYKVIQNETKMSKNIIMLQ